MPAKVLGRPPSTAGRQAPTRGTRSPELVWFLVISVVAFLLRLVHLLQLQHSDPLFLLPQMDAMYHHEWAQAVAAGREFIADAFFRAPLYPYFLGLLYWLSGTSQLVARIVQSLIGSAGCGLVYLLARQFLQPQAASPKQQANQKTVPDRSSSIVHRSDAVPRIAGLVMAAYPLAIWYDSQLLLEGLLTFLVVLGLVLLLRSRDTDRQWWLPGLVFGLAAITRPNVLAFLAVLPVWFWLERGRSSPTGPTRRRVLAKLVQVWGAAALVILPVTIRNYVVSRQFVPIAWQAGSNFVMGNNPMSDGVTAVIPGTRRSWWGGYDDAIRLAEKAEGRSLRGAEVDRYWMSKGLEFWQRRPGSALGLLLRKTFLWFAGYEVSNESSLYVVKRYSFINYLLFDSRFLKFPFGILLPLALAGVWLRRRDWRRFLPLYLFIVTYSLSFVAFFVTGRFRVPMVPIVVILAVMGIMGLVGRKGKISARWPALAIAVASFLFVNADLVRAVRQTVPDQGHFVSAVGLRGQGREAEALVEVRRALESDSGANVLKLEATLLASVGRFAEAESAARAAMRLHPSNADAYGALGYVLATAGRLDSGAHYYELALARDPHSLDAWSNLGNIAFSRRDIAKARYYYEGALKERPTFADAMFYLGLCDHYEGKLAEARARWQEVLRLDPSFTRARQALEQLEQGGAQ
ncbi:tetratricopeptide repeat protein [candidate division WOR-3 bacterium]|nr:tetratricopeptide repeat protein [candidate division WOR-3 bacterium]